MYLNRGQEHHKQVTKRSVLCPYALGGGKAQERGSSARSDLKTGRVSWEGAERAFTGSRVGWIGESAQSRGHSEREQPQNKTKVWETGYDFRGSVGGPRSGGYWVNTLDIAIGGRYREGAKRAYHIQ